MSLMNSCLELLFTPLVPPPPPLTNPLDGDGDGTVATERAPPPPSSASTPSTGAGRRTAKRARGETTGCPDPGKLAAGGPPPFEQRPHLQQKQQQEQESVKVMEEAEVSALSTVGAGVSATFLGRLAAAEALAELARAAAVVRGTWCDAGTVTGTAAATAPAAKTGSRRHNGKQAPLATAGRHGSAGSVKTAAVITTTLELVMSAVAERAGSGWAWERELALLLMDACCAGRRDGEGEERERGVVHVSLR